MGGYSVVSDLKIFFLKKIVGTAKNTFKGFIHSHHLRAIRVKEKISPYTANCLVKRGQLFLGSFQFILF